MNLHDMLGLGSYETAWAEAAQGAPGDGAPDRELLGWCGRGR